MKALIVALALLIVCTGPALAALLIGQEVHGTIKYCKYTDGVILMVDKNQPCPMR